jgi:hypothetical protein
MPDASYYQTVFSSISIEGGTAEMHRHVGARLRRLAAAARTHEVRTELEERARKHDRLADDLIALGRPQQPDDTGREQQSGAGNESAP